MRTGSLLALAAFAGLLAYAFSRARGVEVTLEPEAAPIGPVPTPTPGDGRFALDAATDQTYAAPRVHPGDPSVRH